MNGKAAAAAFLAMMTIAAMTADAAVVRNPPGPRGGPGAGVRVVRPNNPPGPRGGPGTNWWAGNPPGPAGGPGTNWENPPGPIGGPGASADGRNRPC